MYILQVGLSYNKGGIESFVMNYYRRLISMDIQFDFVCMYDSLAYEDEIKSLGGHIYYLPNIKKDPFGFKREYRKLLKEKNYQVVHVNMLSAANTVPIRVAKQEKVPVIIAHSHNDRAPGFIRNIMHFMGKPMVKRYANKYFSCSRPAARWLFGNDIVNKEAYELIYNAIPTESFQYDPVTREKYRETFKLEDKLVIGHIGRFEKQKNHRFLLEVFATLIQIQKNAVLMLVGEGAEMEECRLLAKKLGIEQSALFLGTRTDIGPILSAMDVFCFPSLFEGLPLTLLEAQCSGLPCVISDTINNNVIMSEDTKVCSLKQSASDWAELLLSFNHKAGEPDLISSDQSSRSMRSNNTVIQLKKAHFSIETEAEHLAVLYKEG